MGVTLSAVFFILFLIYPYRSTKAAGNSWQQTTDPKYWEDQYIIDGKTGKKTLEFSASRGFWKAYIKKFNSKNCVLRTGAQIGYRDIANFQEWRQKFFRGYGGFTDNGVSDVGHYVDVGQGIAHGENVILETDKGNGNGIAFYRFDNSTQKSIQDQSNSGQTGKVAVGFGSAAGPAGTPTMAKTWRFYREGKNQEKGGQTKYGVNIAVYNLICPQAVFNQAEQDVFKMLNNNSFHPTIDELATTAKDLGNVYFATGLAANKTTGGSSPGASGAAFTFSRAAAPTGDSSTALGLPIGSTSRVKKFSEYLELVFNWAMEMIGILAILMVIYGGYRYITSQGDQQGITEAKDIIIGALSGLLLVLLSYLILNAVSPDLVAFQ